VARNVPLMSFLRTFSFNHMSSTLELWR
jgi:hypothetical protein